MKILSIRIKNLASLEGTTEINFTEEPLCSAGIFAITGATGAGKSTILDALCLALYSKTPRYLQAKETGIEILDVPGNKLTQSDVRGILRDGTADGYAEVDFRGIDGQHYRANWSVRRARNKADGSMQSDSVTLQNITAHVAIPGKKAETLKEIERLVGLNFEQFTRSVLLAQGDFTAFMKASKDEKSSLLEKLTGTHIYSEISKKIFEKYKSEELQLRELNLRKEGIATLHEDDLKTLVEEQDVLATQIKTSEKEIENLTIEINWHEQLAKLEASHLEANTTLQQATEQQANAFPRRQKLVMTEQVQQTRSWVDAQKHAQQQYGEKTIALNSLKESIVSLQIQQEKLEVQLLASGNELITKSKVFDEALPILEQAKKLDTLIAEKKETLEKAKKEADHASETNSQQQKLRTDKQATFTALSAQIKTITNWKTENIDRSPIAENKDIILSKLQDAKRLLETVQSSTKELDGLKDKIHNSEIEKTTIEASLSKQSQEWESLKKTYDGQLLELLLIPIETLNQHKEEINRTVEHTIQAQAHWQLLDTALTELQTLSQKQLTDQADYQTKQQSLAELSGKLVIENAQKETTAQLLQQSRLASAENVETLRANLIDEQPCPVCGSTSHPYTLQHPAVQNVLAKLEEAYAEKERIYLSTYRQHNALEQAFQTLAQTIQNQWEAIDAKQTALENKKQIWEQFEIAQESQAIADVEKASWIAEKLHSLKTKQADLLVQINAYSSQKQLLEADKIKIDLLKETIDLLTNQLKDVKTAIALHQEQQSGKVKEQQKAALDLNEVEKILSPYFTTSEWMKNWKADPITFVGRIEAFAKTWNENTEKLAQYLLQEGALAATLKELENQAKNFAAELNKKTDAYAIQHQNYQDLKQQRLTIFNGKPATDVETQLKQAIVDAQKQLDQLKAIQQELSINSAKANTQKEELLTTLNTLEIEARQASQKTEAWLSDYNLKNNLSLSVTELHQLLALNNDWMDAERKTLQAIDDEVTKATSILTERKQLLDSHQQKNLSERSLNELNGLFSVAKSEVELQKHKRSEIGFQLQQDEANKNKIGALLKSITTQAGITENWSKLNEIIGSADGKKFRQIAQEYTLDVLLGYANIHLRVLTSRYKIERIPATLGLQVVDQDMGDEVRTVYSLSGGESFLVSLALALGLASLSSSRMKVESLFIDEGFGSLDPTTLNIAMDALERLHNQGRKVGVISHVQEMTERIPVQIKVSKQQSGKSKVEVLGI
ncbi:AAA family ATPase [Agrobacterium tumefaciens]|nr:AAA family ATPase [Agrobacterium tumefaciens]NTE18019.1 AAA family ATPase [Agrobacterium tumefaciens]